MKTTKLITSAIVGASILGLSTLSAQATDYKMTAGSSHPPIVPWAKQLKDLVVPETAARAAKLGHSIKWVEAYSGALYDFKETLEGVEDGRADVGWVGTLWETNKMPLHNVTFFAPFGSTSASANIAIMNEMYKTIPELDQQWTKHNQKLLGYFAGDEYVLLTKKPINTMEDLKGLQIFAPGAIGRWLEGTGATGVNGGLPVYYDGVKKGTADGVISPGTGILPFKLFEVAPFVTRLQLGASLPGGLTMNLDTWKKLEPEMQQMFLDIGAEWSKTVTAQVDGFSAKTFQILEKNPNVTVSTFPEAEMKKWAAAVPDIAGDWAKSVEAKGLPANAMLKAYMEGVRKSGQTPLRDWDK